MTPCGTALARKSLRDSDDRYHMAYAEATLGSILRYGSEPETDEPLERLIGDPGRVPKALAAARSLAARLPRDEVARTETEPFAPPGSVGPT